MHDQRFCSLAAFHQPRRTVTARHPDAPAFPTGIRIIDTALEALGVKAEGIGNPQRNKFAIAQCMDAIKLVAGSDRYILAQTQ